MQAVNGRAFVMRSSCPAATSSSVQTHRIAAPFAWKSTPICLTVVRAQSGLGDEGSRDVEPQWWDNLNRKRGIKGPGVDPSASSDANYMEGMLGEKGVQMWTEIRKSERQRVWDSMRAAARQRYENGEMPDWFDPSILDQEEAPVNKLLRESGFENYQYDDTWVGQGSGGSGGPGGRGRSGGGGGGWWREDDPYWPLRDWGDHPMRWWTFGFAAILAAGGLLGYMLHGSAESLLIGWPAAAVLCTCAMAMSDMGNLWYGHMAVKVAWAVCALLALKQLAFGWQHRPALVLSSGPSLRASSSSSSDPSSSSLQRPWQLDGCGAACVAMCVAYMWSGMSGMWEHHLPDNPGSVYKAVDVAQKSRIWQQWGYGSVSMR